MLTFLIIGINVNAQIKESTGEPVYFTGYRVRYMENDTSLSEEGRALIDTLCQKIVTAGIDSFFAKREVVLQSYTTVKESERNHLIGLIRCMAILDYIENKYKISRVKFLIRVRIPTPNPEAEVVFAFFRKLQ